MNSTTDAANQRKPMTADEDPITSPPYLDKFSRAWRIDLDAMYRVLGLSRSAGADIAGWIVEAPWAHPMWHSYWITLLHLRPIDGMPPPNMYMPGATHELWVSALDPSEPRQPQIDGLGTKPLSPLNFAAQIMCSCDEVAASLIESAVIDIVAGTLSPDTDYIGAWAARFGDNMMRHKVADGLPGTGIDLQHTPVRVLRNGAWVSTPVGELSWITDEEIDSLQWGSRLRSTLSMAPAWAHSDSRMRWERSGAAIVTDGGQRAN